MNVEAKCQMNVDAEWITECECQMDVNTECQMNVDAEGITERKCQMNDEWITKRES
jgi:hypothetical protein